MFQLLTNGSMSTAKSSNAAAALIQKSERGGAVAGTAWSTRASLHNGEAHLQAERRREPESEQAGEVKAVEEQPSLYHSMGAACICDWSSRPQGTWSMERTLLEGPGMARG